MTHLAAQYFLNHRLDAAEVAAQTRMIAEAGYDGIMAHARPGMLTPYFSQEWWDAVDAIHDACSQSGASMWIWDEDYFPSGTAGGRVTWDEPAFYARELLFAEHRITSDGGRIELDFRAAQLLCVTAYREAPDGSLGEPVDLMAYCGTRRQTWGERRIIHAAYSAHVDPAGPPHWRASFTDNRWALVWTPPAPGVWVIIATQAATIHGMRPDILAPEATQAFIAAVYEPYATRYGDALGRTITGLFTDEPNPGTGHFPWSRHLPAAFAADHGYDVREALPHLARDLGPQSPGIRWQYRQTQHRLQRAAFTGLMAAWCREHRLIFAGHLTRTEWLSLTASMWPNELRFYADFDIPCADPLGAAIAWPDAAAYHTGLKVVSSAAHVFGKLASGSDALAVMGEECGLRDMKHHLDFHMVMGLTWFNLHGLNYSMDGPRKDEVPPSLFYQHSQWPYMRPFLDAVRATCEALSAGRHRCTIALLYPSTSVGAQFDGTRKDWFCIPDEAAIHAIVEALLSHQRDFDFIDETTLQERVDVDGTLATAEDYTVIVLPRLRFIEAETAAALERLLAAGRRVLAVDTLPRCILRQGSAPVRDWSAPAALEQVEAADADWLTMLPGPTLSGAGNRDVFLLQREVDGEARSFAVNRAETAFDGALDGVPVWLAPRGSAFFADTEGSREPLAGATFAADLSRDWELRIARNQLPLSTWHPVLGPDLVYYGRPVPIDLLHRQAPPPAKTPGPRRFYTRFFTLGAITDLTLLMEDSALSDGGHWRVTVNGQASAPMTRCNVFDCLNLQTDIAPLLRQGSVATLNEIHIETDGGDLVEMPFLLGGFRSEFRHGHPSLPYLTAADGRVPLDTLADWTSIGYGSFSGVASYHRELRIEQAGDYLLDLGRVEDVAELRLDGQSLGTAAWPPYVLRLPALAAGTHRLEIRVANPPANRTRLANRPAGLLGPVRLFAAPGSVPPESPAQPLTSPGLPR